MLIIVLWLLAALSLLALGLAYRLRLESRIQRYRHARTEMLELARAAVTLASARIERSDGALTFCGQPWARPIVLDERDMTEMAGNALERYTAEALVFDELGRLNVNLATRGQLLSIPGMDEAISGAIIDWRDADDVPLQLGAESRYYARMEVPYACKSAPLESIWELLLVRGIDRDVFGAARREPLIDTQNPLWRYRETGLRDFLTVRGDGRINLNTACPEVLIAAVPGLDELMIESLMWFRDGADGVARTADDRGIASFESLHEIGGMTEFAINQAAMRCVLSSDVFHVRVQVTERKSGAQLNLDVGLKRGERGLETIFWREG